MKRRLLLSILCILACGCVSVLAADAAAEAGRGPLDVQREAERELAIMARSAE